MTQYDIDKSEVSEGEYQGNKMLIIKTMPNDRFPFQMGLKKAQPIVKHIEDIRAFVSKHNG